MVKNATIVIKIGREALTTPVTPLFCTDILRTGVGVMEEQN